MEAQDVYYGSSLGKFNSYRSRGRGRLAPSPSRMRICEKKEVLF